MVQMNMWSSSRKVKQKWDNREEMEVDREYDVFLLPSNGGCVSDSEYEGSNGRFVDTFFYV